MNPLKFQILLELLKQGDGATQAKQELEQVKAAAEQTGESTTTLTAATDAANVALAEQAAAMEPVKEVLAATGEAARETAAGTEALNVTTEETQLKLTAQAEGVTEATTALEQLGEVAKTTDEALAKTTATVARAEQAHTTQTTATQASAEATRQEGLSAETAAQQIIQQAEAVSAASAALGKNAEQAQEASAAVNKLGDEAERSGLRLQKISKEVIAAGAAMLGGLAIRSSIQAYTEQDQVAARLAASLRNAGLASREYVEELQAQAEAKAQLTGVDEELISGVDAQLITFGAQINELPRLREGILDVAAAGYNLATVTEAVGAAINGNFTSAARLLKVQFDENATAAENMNRLLQIMEERFGGMAVAARRTASGELKATQQSIGDINKEVGKLLVEGLQPVIREFGGMAKAVAGFMKENQLLMQSIVPLGAILTGELVAALLVTIGISKLAGMAGLKLGADWLATAASIKTAAATIATTTASMSMAVMASIGALTVGLYTLAKAYQAVEAAQEEAQSQQELAELNITRRNKTEQLIQTKLEAGQISEAEADQMRSVLADAFFAPTENFQPPFTPGMAFPLKPVTRQVRDLPAESAALKSVAQKLEPEVFTPQPKAQPVPTGKSEKDNSDSFNQLRELTERLEMNRLTGLEKERAAIEANYQERQRQIEQVSFELQLGTEQVAQLEEMNLAVREQEQSALAAKEAQRQKNEEKQREAEVARAVTDELQTFEQQLTTVAVGSSESRVERAQREYEARLALYQKLYEAGRISEERLTELTRTAALQRVEVLAAAAEQGRLEVEKLKARQISLWAEETVEINRQFEVRRQNLLAYYQFEIEQAEGNAQRIAELEGEKTLMLEQLQIQQRRAVSQTWQDLARIGEATKQNFASGLSSMIVNLFDSTKKASDILKGFISSLLQQTGQLILQTLVLRALAGAFGGAASGAGGASGTITGPTGTTLSTGPQFSNVGMSLTPLAEGGVLYNGFNTLRAYASGGVGAALKSTLPPALMASAMLYASDINGVQTVNQPTVLPEFGALAGEAGTEMLTVLAQPRKELIAGLEVVVGNAGSQKLAMLDRAALEEKVQQWLSITPQMPTPMTALAAGGILNGSAPSGSCSGSGSTFPATVIQQPNGKLMIEVTMAPGLQAAIVKEAIEGAEVRLTQAAGEDSGFSRAIKERVA
jgi:hypothetical protein